MTEKVFGTHKEGSIRDIPLPTDAGSNHDLNLRKPARDDFDDWNDNAKRNKKPGAKLLIALVAMIILGIAYSYLFHRATVVVTPRTISVQVANQQFEAQLQATDGIEFVRVTPFNRVVSMYVEGSLEENRQTKASGILTVYNTDKTPKTYIKNTRFITEDGRLYRAFKKFVIPAGTANKPGSVDVLVNAENPGDKYNSDEALTFTLPALKEQGDPAYDLVYAKQNGVLSGGFSGIIRVPTEDDIEETKIKLTTRIKQELEQEFVSSMSANYIINTDYMVISDPTFSEKPNAEKGGMDLEARATLNAVVFERSTFESFMAQQLIPDYTQGVVHIVNVPELTMTVIDTKFDPMATDAFTFSVVGEPQFEWPVVEDDIARLLTGKLKSHIMNNLVNDLDNVEIIDVSVSPMWRRSLPGNASHITVTVQ